jgi:large-conductance mechanosensitive channel
MAEYQDVIDKFNDSLDKVIEKGEDDFEKQLIFIASGALGISFAFIEKIVNLNQSIYFPMLAMAWISFTVAMCVNLTSHYLSIQSNRATKEEFRKCCENKLPRDQFDLNVEKRNKKMDRFNYSSIGLVFVGLFLLIAFVTFNVVNSHSKMPEKRIESTEREQKGRHVPIPQHVPHQAPTSPTPTANPPQTPKQPANK